MYSIKKHDIEKTRKSITEKLRRIREIGFVEYADIISDDIKGIERTLKKECRGCPFKFSYHSEEAFDLSIEWKWYERDDTYRLMWVKRRDGTGKDNDPILDECPLIETSLGTKTKVHSELEEFLDSIINDVETRNVGIGLILKPNNIEILD